MRFISSARDAPASAAKVFPVWRRCQAVTSERDKMAGGQSVLTILAVSWQRGPAHRRCMSVTPAPGDGAPV
jgi:hypothetical protein